MESFTLAEQEAAACALHTLCRIFPHLPNAFHAVGPVADADWAQGVIVRIHNDPPAFEAWREALGLDPERLTSRRHSDCLAVSGVVRNLSAPVELVGFLPLPAEPPATSPDAA